MQTRLRAALFAIIFSAAAGPVLAADLPSSQAPALAPAPLFETYDPFQIRLRVEGVIPTSGDNLVYTGGTPYHNGLTVQSQVIPELDLSYYFTRNIAVEAICCFSYHTINAVNALASLGDVGHTWLFPPTITLQYHFTDFGAFQPYLGVGVNYTHYFDTGAGSLAADGPLKINDSWGVAGQVGFDYMITRNLGLNVDLKYIEMTPHAAYVSSTLNSRVNINPIVVGAGITYRFGGGSNAVIAKY